MKASSFVDGDNVANDVATLFQSLNIGDDADNGDERSVRIREASAFVDGASGANNVATLLQILNVADDAVDGNDSVEDGVDPDRGDSSLEGANIARDGDERDHALEPKHKVFLSHSGVQKSFVADLCADLKRRDRHPFFDKLRSSLPIGEKFPKLIFDAIKQCQVGVVVLSEEFFTRSKWPMLELVAMVKESRKAIARIKIILVFYCISRDQCCDPLIQSKWMIQWKKWEEEDKERIDVEEWKRALEVFGSTTGLVMKEGMLDGELRGEIVEAVCKKVLPETRWDDSRVQGKIHLCQKILKVVYKGLPSQDLSSGVRVVGLYGMGGIGKTTACKTLCNELSKEYNDKVCHAELGSLSGEELLQKVLCHLTDLDAKILDKLDVGVCHGYLKTHTLRQRVFLALDNVSDESMEQAKSYLQAKFGDGSVVLVTARSVDLLKCLRIPKEDCLEMPKLELEEAKSLFLNHARLKKNEIDEELLVRCLERCYFSKGDRDRMDKHYHPLALKVLGTEVGDLGYGMEGRGALLRRIDTFNLSRQKEHPVFSILRSSFDSLLEEDQLLFMDVALWLLPKEITMSQLTVLEWLGKVHGKMEEEVIDMLECLKRKSLLEDFGVSFRSDFRMHDLWREFAAAEIKVGKFREQRYIFEAQGCSGSLNLSHLSNIGVLKLVDVPDLVLDLRGLKHLKSLEVIPFRGSVVLEVNGLGTLENLIFLRCFGIASSACIEELGCLTKLEVVELYDFRGDKLPDMSKLTNLRILDLRWSLSLKSINLRNLTNLTELGFNGCPSLRELDISGCSSLKEPNMSYLLLIPSQDPYPGGNAFLRKLRKLDITGCRSITALDNLRYLVALEELRATECKNLAKLPRCRLPNLRVLDIEPKKVPGGFQWGLGVKPIRRFKKH